MDSRAAEHQEWERAIGLLGRSTRPGRLLEYLGTKYFQQPEVQLTEFEIATDVFGRSPKTFDPTEDAVVRVEAHRLRKKLRQLYEKDDRAQGLQLSLPAGTYVLKFTAPAEKAADTPESARPVPKRTGTLVIAGVITAAILAAIVTVVIRRDSPVRAATAAPPAASSATPTAVASNETPGRQTELHMMSGHVGSEVIDNSGVRWTPDRFFTGGGVWTRDGGFLRGTSRPFLFAKWRTGEFGYNIPAAPGTYELRLFFVSPQLAGDEKLGGFDIALNGKSLIGDFDILMSANGAGTADEQVFRDVTPREDGIVQLWFSNRAGSPLINALELTPGIPGKLKPIRITMQPTSYVDHKGQRWRADDYFTNGFPSLGRRQVSGTEDPELFGAERFGHFSYAIPVDRRGRYTVILHFAEFYYGPQLPGGGGAGSRIFHVFCNGQTLLRNFDIFKEAGSRRVITKTFKNVEPSAQGKINLDFEPVVNNATISGIEIIDESE
jgi:hypothetical protein